MTTALQKLIADCSTVTHGGVSATTQHTKLAKVAEALLNALNEVMLSDECHEAWFHAIAQQAIREAENIAAE